MSEPKIIAAHAQADGFSEPEERPVEVAELQPQEPPQESLEEPGYGHGV